MSVAPTRVGVISDTHGLLRPQAVAALAGSELILHAGDVGGAEILAALEAIAPVYAVRGNNDRAPWADTLPERRIVEVSGMRILLLHDAGQLAGDSAQDCEVVITGHSHRPRLERREGVLHLNPGSAGPRRFRLPVSLARLDVVAGEAHAELVELQI